MAGFIQVNQSAGLPVILVTKPDSLNGSEAPLRREAIFSTSMLLMR